MDPMHTDRPAPVDPRWHVVVPVKGRAGAKTRLLPPDGVDRGALAVAMAQDALDVVRSVVGASHLLVVTGDQEVAAVQRAAGAVVVPDPGGGLVAAVLAGLDSLPASASRAVLLGDLPALRPSELAAALETAGATDRAFVADRQGTGTTLLTALGGVVHDPRFGPGSAAAHVAAGYHPLSLALPTVRTDVDDAGDLAAALALGCGPATTALLAPAVSA